jgi:copper chaperone
MTPTEVEMTDFKVSGMTCGHCVATVTRAVKAVDPAAEVSIDRVAGRVKVLGTAAPERLRAAIEEEGYRVEIAA